MSSDWFSKDDPPAPLPPEELLRFWPFFKALNDNPITAWPKRAYQDPCIHLPGDSMRPGVLLATDPMMVKRIMLDAVSIYDKGDVVRRRLKPFLGDGILIAPEASWRPQRRITAPMFQMRRITQFFDDMRLLADAEANELEQLALTSDIDLHDRLIGLTYDVIARTAFSDQGVSDPKAFSRAIADYFSTLGRVDFAAYLRLPEWIPTINRLRSRPALRLFRREIGKIVEDRRAMLAKNGADDLPDDLLTRLFLDQDPKTGRTLDDDRVYDNAVVFLGAGHETTANLLAWTMFLLSTHPVWEDQVIQEIEREVSPKGLQLDTLERLVVCRAVLEETLRLYPPAPIIPREVLEDDRLVATNGETVDIKAGTIVFTSPFIAQRHRSHWQHPNRFDPARFLGEGASSIDRFVHFPFGAGPRICMGASFAIQEALTILVTLLGRFHFECVNRDEIFPIGTITLRPADRLMMRVTKR